MPRPSYRLRPGFDRLDARLSPSASLPASLMPGPIAVPQHDPDFTRWLSIEAAGIVTPITDADRDLPPDAIPPPMPGELPDPPFGPMP